MNARRYADIAKIVGAVCAGCGSIGSALLMLADMLPPGKLAATMILVGTAGSGLAGWATRFFGQEYADVAEAKVMAKLSVMPPPAPPLSSAPTDPPPPAAA